MDPHRWLLYHNRIKVVEAMVNLQCKKAVSLILLSEDVLELSQKPKLAAIIQIISTDPMKAFRPVRGMAPQMSPVERPEAWRIQ